MRHADAPGHPRVATTRHLIAHSDGGAAAPGGAGRTGGDVGGLLAGRAAHGPTIVVLWPKPARLAPRGAETRRWVGGKDRTSVRSKRQGRNKTTAQRGPGGLPRPLRGPSRRLNYTCGPGHGRVASSGAGERLRRRRVRAAPGASDRRTGTRRRQVRLCYWLRRAGAGFSRDGGW